MLLKKTVITKEKKVKKESKHLNDPCPLPLDTYETEYGGSGRQLSATPLGFFHTRSGSLQQNNAAVEAKTRPRVACVKQFLIRQNCTS